MQKMSDWLNYRAFYSHSSPQVDSFSYFYDFSFEVSLFRLVPEPGPLEPRPEPVLVRPVQSHRTHFQVWFSFFVLFLIFSYFEDLFFPLRSL